MRLYLINPSNPLVSIVKVEESRWNRYRVWKPLSLMLLAGLTPPEWEISIVDENLGAQDLSPLLSQAETPAVVPVQQVEEAKKSEKGGSGRTDDTGNSPAHVVQLNMKMIQKINLIPN